MKTCEWVSEKYSVQRHAGRKYGLSATSRMSKSQAELLTLLMKLIC